MSFAGRGKWADLKRQLIKNKADKNVSLNVVTPERNNILQLIVAYRLYSCEYHVPKALADILPELIKKIDTHYRN